MAQAGGGGGGGQPQGDHSMGVAWVMALFIITLYIIWRYEHDKIVYLIFHLNLYQAKLINFFLHSDELTKDIYILETVDVSKVTWNQVLAMTAEIGNYFRYPVIVILTVCAFVLYKSNVTLKYKRTHSMGSLREQEQDVWPAIAPVVKQDLVELDINQGVWAMALTPMEFARKNNLLRKDDLVLDATVLPSMAMTAGLRKGDAKRVFTLQLGPYWEGFERLSPHAHALAGIFMARMNRDAGGANKALEALAKSTAQGKPNYSVASGLVKKYKDTEIVQRVIVRHAYVYTVMASLIEAARDDGVVPSSEFLWLKTVDRRLWYMLNCVGRQTPYAEVGGPFAHWKAEILLGRKSIVPMIDEAIKALEIAIKEVKLSHEQLEELEP